MMSLLNKIIALMSINNVRIPEQPELIKQLEV